MGQRRGPSGGGRDRHLRGAGGAGGVGGGQLVAVAGGGGGGAGERGLVGGGGAGGGGAERQPGPDGHAVVGLRLHLLRGARHRGRDAVAGHGGGLHRGGGRREVRGALRDGSAGRDEHRAAAGVLRGRRGRRPRLGHGLPHRARHHLGDRRRPSRRGAGLGGRGAAQPCAARLRHAGGGVGGFPVLLSDAERAVGAVLHAVQHGKGVRGQRAMRESGVALNVTPAASSKRYLGADGAEHVQRERRQHPSPEQPDGRCRWLGWSVWCYEGFV
mmetsp:Transcript_37508/g.99828  ORF Transcript_37508/g.99828 Transcript_37508/m.99828 type:complete len:271 (+) Transcript_37508:2152-2964(+)